jgi:hypothetical protein
MPTHFDADAEFDYESDTVNREISESQPCIEYHMGTVDYVGRVGQADSPIPKYFVWRARLEKWHSKG